MSLYTLLPITVRDLKIVTDVTIFEANTEIIKVKFPFIANCLPVEVINMPNLNQFGTELLQLAHHDIGILPRLKSNSDIMNYIVSANYLGLDTNYLAYLVDHLLRLDIDLDPLLNNLTFLKGYFNCQSKLTLSKRVFQTCQLNFQPRYLDFLNYLEAGDLIKFIDYFEITDLTSLKITDKLKLLNLITLVDSSSQIFLFSPEMVELINSTRSKMSDPPTIEDVVIYNYIFQRCWLGLKHTHPYRNIVKI